MAKFYGKIGYAMTRETAPGVWLPEIVEKDSYGDVLKHRKTYSSSDTVNDDLSLSVEISILQDPFAVENFHLIKYVEFGGVKWKVRTVDPQYPRLILSLGEVYTGENGG